MGRRALSRIILPFDVIPRTFRLATFETPSRFSTAPRFSDIGYFRLLPFSTDSSDSVFLVSCYQSVFTLREWRYAWLRRDIRKKYCAAMVWMEADRPRFDGHECGTQRNSRGKATTIEIAYPTPTMTSYATHNAYLSHDNYIFDLKVVLYVHKYYKCAVRMGRILVTYNL